MAVAPCAGPQCTTLKGCSTVAQTWLYCSAVCRTRPHEAWSTRQDKNKTARSMVYKGSTTPHEDPCSLPFCACLRVENCQKLNVHTVAFMSKINKCHLLACVEIIVHDTHATAMQACRMRYYQRGKCGRAHAGRGVCRSGHGALIWVGACGALGRSGRRTRWGRFGGARLWPGWLGPNGAGDDSTG
jgi:hypothetical protein